MGKSEIIVFIVLVNIILLILISGIVVFIMQYRKRKLQFEKEKAAIEEQHQLDLLQNKVQTQQQTMQFIGSEIHDSVAQKLTLASIYSQQLEYENRHPELLDKLGSISNIINDSLNELRDLAKTLASSDIQEEDLVQLLQKECVRVNDTGVCKMELNAAVNLPMSISVKRILLRVLQEFVQNSIKHSSCSIISIQIINEENGIRIAAADNGRGFNESVLKMQGMGLNNMKRRIQLIGGTFNLESSEGNGTSINIFIDNKKLMA